MSRTYIAYVNDRKAGLTWSALVAASLIILNKACNSVEVSLHIWGKKDPPPDLRARVGTALSQMADKGFVTKMSGYNYRITLLGQHVFGTNLDTDMNLSRMSDSVLFDTGRKRKTPVRKKRRA